MSRSYLSNVASTRRTPQSESVPGKSMVQDSDGAYVFGVGPLERLRRFLILGSEGGSYYASERKLTKENAENLRRALDEFGTVAVDEIVEVSEAGRAPKNDEAIFALAAACAHDNTDVKEAALAAIPRVCRTGTHLFQFAEFVEQFRGWGRALKKAVGEWYLREPEKVAYQAVKYRQRADTTHADVLRRTKPGAEGQHLTPTHRLLFEWISTNADVRLDSELREQYGLGEPRYPQSEGKSLEDCMKAMVKQHGEDFPNGVAEDALRSVEAFERAQAAESTKETIKLIEQYGGALPWEAVRSDHMKDKAVTEALIRGGMPMGALVRQLGRMTGNDVLEPMSDLSRFVAERITSADAIRGSRLHPISVLKAFLVYKSGRSEKGSGRWSPVREVVDALDEAFYLAFPNVPKTGKRTMLALDVSASMTWKQIAGMGNLLDSREASAAMALVQANVGDPYMITAFSAGGLSYGRRLTSRRAVVEYEGVEEIDISPRQRLDGAIRDVSELYATATDCALPMVYATSRDLEIDTFVIYTDHETNTGVIHPFQALVEYREKSGIPARLVVVAMVSNGFTIADPNDAGMLDVVGFDTNAPTLISDFSAGKV